MDTLLLNCFGVTICVSDVFLFLFIDSIILQHVESLSTSTLMTAEAAEGSSTLSDIRKAKSSRPLVFKVIRIFFTYLSIWNGANWKSLCPLCWVILTHSFSLFQTPLFPFFVCLDSKTLSLLCGRVSKCGLV